MTLRMMVSDVKELHSGIWIFDLPPYQVRLLGNASQAEGSRSVILLNSAIFDPEAKVLQFDAAGANVMNIGTTPQAIAISTHTSINCGSSSKITAEASNQAIFGPGDRQFLSLAEEELSPEMSQTARHLLGEVRMKSTGDLKRGKNRNFSETPDNFWYTIIQPSIDELSITVRGSVEHFANVAALDIKDDRGNTRFKVKSEKDIEAALKLIFHAIRKKS